MCIKIERKFRAKIYKSTFCPACGESPQDNYGGIHFCGSTAKSQRRGRTERLGISTVHEHEMKTQNLLFPLHPVVYNVREFSYNK